MFKWSVESTPATALSFLKNSCLRSLYKLHFKRKCNSSSVSLALQNLHKRLVELQVYNIYLFQYTRYDYLFKIYSKFFSRQSFLLHLEMDHFRIFVLFW